jgi:hypothetical protein
MPIRISSGLITFAPLKRAACHAILCAVKASGIPVFYEPPIPSGPITKNGPDNKVRTVPGIRQQTGKFAVGSDQKR